MTYEVKRGVLGGVARVYYGCDGCNEKLNSSLTQAGANDSCPSCGRVHVVPGERERKQEQLAKAAADELAAKQTEEKRRQDQKRREREIRKKADTALQSDLGVQQAVEAERAAARQGDTHDRHMWKAFDGLRRVLAFQLQAFLAITLLGLLVAVLALLALVACAVVPSFRGGAWEAWVIVLFGLGAAFAGYMGYLSTAAFTALLVYVERNTRAALAD